VTVAEALTAIRRVGTVENCAGKLKLKFPEGEQTVLQPAIDILRTGKAEAIALLAAPDPTELVRAWRRLCRPAACFSGLRSCASKPSGSSGKRRKHGIHGRCWPQSADLRAKCA
jgi:hypothetical protein